MRIFPQQFYFTQVENYSNFLLNPKCDDFFLNYQQFFEILLRGNFNGLTWEVENSCRNALLEKISSLIAQEMENFQEIAFIHRGRKLICHPLSSHLKSTHRQAIITSLIPLLYRPTKSLYQFEAIKTLNGIIHVFKSLFRPSA